MIAHSNARPTDRAGFAAALDGAGVAWREVDPAERARYAVDGIEPTLICWPTTAAEAAAALGAADQFGLAVSPRGAGTKVGLGNPPRRGELIVSTERLARLIDYAPENLTMSIEAGAPFRVIQTTLGERGQFLPLDPPNADSATIGGIVAANASGPIRLGYGSARDLVIGTRVAHPSGLVSHAGGRVVKNVAGYDLNKLYIGSLGTLALITELTFKVAPLPEAEATVVGRFASGAALAAAVQTIIRSPLMPIALDLLDSAAAASVDGFEGRDGSFFLLARGAGLPSAVTRQRTDVTKIMHAAGGHVVGELLDSASRRVWTAIRELANVGDGERVVGRLAVPIAALPRVLEEIARRKIAPPGVAVWGRAGTGVLYLRWPASEDSLADAARLIDLRAMTVRLEGSLVIEACPLALKRRLDVWGDVGAQLSVMRRLKASLDPNNVMNPGRFVGGI